jgi:hypothetical protein
VIAVAEATATGDLDLDGLERWLAEYSRYELGDDERE